jgi:branched-chain amino acid aminotransferase
VKLADAAEGTIVMMVRTAHLTGAAPADRIPAADYAENEAGTFYEVIRIIGGKALFLNAHYERLSNSMRLAGKSLPGLSFDMLKARISDLLIVNRLRECNVKIVVFAERDLLCLYVSPHHYPDAEERKRGVQVTLIRIERKNPNIKQLDADFKRKVAEAIRERNAFEALLVDDNGNITEGGRTNVFFILGGKVRTAPESMVLKGITRAYILKACADAGIEVAEEPVRADEAGTAAAVFISGTSIKVLPVSGIDTLRFDPGNETMKRISDAFDRIMEEDLSQ